MDIRAFRGWRYRMSDDRDVSTLIAPPYDVVSAGCKRALLAGCERNIVAVDLPHVPPEQAGPDRAYARAAETLDQWKAGGLLVQDERPCVYLYQQTYTWAGKTHTRRAIICGLRVTESGRDVIPHEHTFDGPKADRLKLTEHTRMQLSPIFAFYRDPRGQVADLLARPAEAAPSAHGRLDGVDQSIWAVSEPDVIASIAEVLRDSPIYIADGHHRYTTAVNYADALRESGQIDADHEANFVMFALVAQDDPGLLVLPTHRIVRDLESDFTLGALMDRAAAFHWRPCEPAEVDLADADAFLRPHGAGAMAVIGPRAKESWIARLKDASAMVAAAPDQCEPWRRLDVAALHRLILAEALAPWRRGELSIDYTPDGAEVLAACADGRAQLGLCLQRTPLAAVVDVADAGAVMPHKSTYFYPKLATGMVLKPLE
ncbi:MAG: DUF1015 domain-containing protein [Phycisphaerae bacterium]|jgi:uncharacterized protein (DUF1015 family)|nr:DUF1015 domain-containing protein [Phycisphaerae bacterium]MDP7637333.1 DUF1015 domain-containing protein [Phycisphaerae bacterium]